MSRKNVVEITCERCPRIEYREDTGSGPVSFTAVLGEAEYHFGDLCTPCTQAVAQYLEQIARRLNTMSPDRSKDVAKKEGDVTLPQDVSAAAKEASHGRSKRD